MGKNRLITDKKSVAKIKYLHIERHESGPKHVNLSNNLDLSPVNKFPNHPSVLKIKSNQIGSSFSFQLVNHEEVLTEL